MNQILAQSVPQQQNLFQIVDTYPDPIGVAFIWATWLLGAFGAVQLVLHAILCIRPSSAVLSGTASPVVVLKVAVLYFVASLIVGLYNSWVNATDFVAAGGQPDPVMFYSANSETLRYLMLGMIGLFVGLFDYFAFAGNYARLQTTGSEISKTE